MNALGVASLGPGLRMMQLAQTATGTCAVSFCLPDSPDGLDLQMGERADADGTTS